MKRLFFFTNSYPYGIAESWKTEELNYLSNYFSEIIVVPNNFGGNAVFKGLVKTNITYRSPLFDNEKIIRVRYKFIQILFSRFAFFFIKFIFKETKIFNKEILIDWLISFHNILTLIKNEKLKLLLSEITEIDYLYFFWGRGTSELLGFLKVKAKTIVRYHGFDLYHYRHKSGILPFQLAQIKNADLNLCISRNGTEYLKNKYPLFAHKIVLNELGIVNEESGIYSDFNFKIMNKEFVIFTCSSIIPLKRLEIILFSLKLISNVKIKWIHIGDGPGRKNLEDLSILLGENINFLITGWLTKDEIFNLYKNEKPNLFINVSIFEGLPVSIIEACSFGIPIIATNVGGNNEIVDDSNGKLIDDKITPERLKETIINFYDKSTQEFLMLSKNSLSKFQQKFDSRITKKQLINLLLEI